MKKLTFTLLAAALGLAALPTTSHARFVFTLTQTGPNVTITGSGSLNFTGLSLSSSQLPASFSGQNAAVAAGTGSPQGVSGATGPANFGFSSTALLSPTTTTGDSVAIRGASGQVNAPSGYVSGNPLSNLSVYNNQTFTSLGFVPGTYTYTFNTGANLDTIVVTSVVPEPSTWALLGVGVAGLGVVTYRRRARLA